MIQTLNSPSLKKRSKRRLITPSCRSHQCPKGHQVTEGGKNGVGWGLYHYVLAPNAKALVTKQENTKRGSSVCQADVEKKKKTHKTNQTKINFQDKYTASILEASSKSWINRSQQWHNLPVTSVGLVIYRFPFEEGRVQGKTKLKLPPHAAPVLSA